MALPDTGPYAPDAGAVAWAQGQELFVGSARGSRSVLHLAGIPLLRADGYHNGRLAFVELDQGGSGKARLLTMNVSLDSAPTPLDVVDFAAAGGGPWPQEPRPVTDGLRVYWLRHLNGPPETYVLMRWQPGTQPGLPGDTVEVYRSADPLLFAANDQGDLAVATTPLGADGRAHLTLIEKTGRIREISSRPAAAAGVPMFVADRIGWTEGLIERHAAVAGSGPGPTTAVELWQLFSGERTRIDLGCQINGATERHLVARCTDHLIVRDLVQGLAGELPLDRGIAVVSQSGVLRQSGQAFLLTPLTPVRDRYPDPPPTVLWAANQPAHSTQVSLYLYFAPPRGTPFGTRRARILDASGTTVAIATLGPNLVLGPGSCDDQVDGGRAHAFTLTASQLADIAAHPSAYRFELETGDGWHPLVAIDSGCRTSI